MLFNCKAPNSRAKLHMQCTADKSTPHDLFYSQKQQEMTIWVKSSVFALGRWVRGIFPPKSQKRVVSLRKTVKETNIRLPANTELFCI